MKEPTQLTRRVEALEAEGGDTDTGIVEVEAEELEAFWQSWDGTLPPTQGQGVALVGRELSISEWEQKFGVVEIDANTETE